MRIRKQYWLWQTCLSDQSQQTSHTHRTLDICWLAQSIQTVPLRNDCLHSFQILSNLKRRDYLLFLDKLNSFKCAIVLLNFTFLPHTNEYALYWRIWERKTLVKPTVRSHGSAAPTWSRSTGRWSTARAPRKAEVRAGAPRRETVEAWLRSCHLGTARRSRWMRQVAVRPGSKSA